MIILSEETICRLQYDWYFGWPKEKYYRTLSVPHFIKINAFRAFNGNMLARVGIELIDGYTT